MYLRNVLSCNLLYLGTMRCIEDKIQAYAEQHCEAAPSLLVRIQEETRAHVPGSQMLVGHLQGRFLALLSHMLQPKRILELGTFTGYSTLCLAEGLQPDGIIHTVDRNVALATTVRNYFEQSDKAHQIRFHLGQASDVIAQLDEVFDLVYIDADKKNYQRYYELILDRVRPGGCIIADNVLWSRKVVLDDTVPSVDKNTLAMKVFNDQVHQDPRVANVLLPIRDGLMILRKK